MLLRQHQRKPSVAFTYALPFSCILDAFCILLLAALVIDLCCLPLVLTPELHQLGRAVDFNHILYFPCAVFCVALVAQLGCFGKSVAGTVAVFVIILQLYFVTTQPRPNPPTFQQGNKIALLSHIAYLNCLHCLL